jgi:hypothetical protein
MQWFILNKDEQSDAVLNLDRSGDLLRFRQGVTPLSNTFQTPFLYFTISFMAIRRF